MNASSVRIARTSKHKMKIGILSDSHKRVGRSGQVIDLLKENGAQQLIHAGDIVKVEILDLLEKSTLPYIAVYGNNDAHLHHVDHHYNLVQEPYHFTIEGLTATLMHHPTYLTYERDIMIYGHTHDFDARYDNNTLIMNPGESCARDKPLSECILLDIQEKFYELRYYYRAIKTDIWAYKTYKFERDK